MFAPDLHSATSNRLVSSCTATPSSVMEPCGVVTGTSRPTSRKPACRSSGGHRSFGWNSATKAFTGRRRSAARTSPSPSTIGTLPWRGADGSRRPRHRPSPTHSQPSTAGNVCSGSSLAPIPPAAFVVSRPVPGGSRHEQPSRFHEMGSRHEPSAGAFVGWRPRGATPRRAATRAP